MVVRLEQLRKALSNPEIKPMFQSEVFIADKEVQPEKADSIEELEPPIVNVSVAEQSKFAQP